MTKKIIYCRTGIGPVYGATIFGSRAILEAKIVYAGQDKYHIFDLTFERKRKHSERHY